MPREMEFSSQKGERGKNKETQKETAQKKNSDRKNAPQRENTDENRVSQERVSSTELDEAYENGNESDIIEYESESDNDSDTESNSEFQISQVGRETNFLIGHQSRYGRAVRFNNRLIR